MPGVLHWVALLRHFQKTHVLNSVFLLLTAQDGRFGRWSMTVLDDSLSPLSIFVYHFVWRQGMFVKHFVHKLEVRCLKLRPWSESPGRQVMHSRGFEGRTHEGLHDPHDRHQFHFNFYHFHLQSILKPMGNECFFSLCLPLSIEIAEKPEDLPSDLASRPFPSSLRRPCRIRHLRKRQPLGLGALERRALECEASRESQENDGKIV